MHFFFLLFSSFFFKQEKKKEGKRNIIAIVFTGRSVTLTELQFNKECRKKNYFFFFLCAYKNSHFYFSGEKWEKLVFPAGEVKLCSKKILRPSYTRMPTFKIVLWLFFFFSVYFAKKICCCFSDTLVLRFTYLFNYLRNFFSWLLLNIYFYFTKVIDRKCIHSVVISMQEIYYKKKEKVVDIDLLILREA